MKRYSLLDNTSGKRARHVEFTGDEVASSDSDDGSAQRWTELTLYHTNTGRYVLSSVGRSVVYHAADATCSRGARPATAVDLLMQHADEDLLPCLTCKPVDVYDELLPGDTMVLMEQDRHTVTVAEKPEGIIETLYRVDAAGVRKVSGLALWLLERAALVDAGIAGAWNLERV